MSEPAPPPVPAELAALLEGAQRGGGDLASVPIAELARSVRQRVDGEGSVGDDDLAELVLGLVRLLRLKAARVLAGEPPASPSPSAPEPPDDPEARLAEARLFRAAADVLISDPAAGPQAFLRVLGVVVEPRVELRVPPEALARALRAVLERLPVALTMSAVPLTHSVAAKVRELRSRLAAGAPLAFAECFEAARDRLEAIAYFLALLELVASGGARCLQDRPGGPIVVERG